MFNGRKKVNGLKSLTGKGWAKTSVFGTGLANLSLAKPNVGAIYSTGSLLRSMIIVVTTLAVLTGCTTTTTSTSRTLTSSNSSSSQKDRSQAALEDYIQLGVAYLQQGNREQAQGNFKRALDIDGRSAAAHNGMALLYQLNREFELAEKHYKNVINYDPDFTRGRNNYAVFLVRQNRLDDAYQQLLIAAEDLYYPRRTQIFLSLGEVASALGKKSEALAAWERVIGLNPKIAMPYLSLSEEYFKEGDYPKAKTYLDQFERLAKPSARSLWLAVRLEDTFGNEDGVSSKGLALKNLFPYSEQALAYKDWLQQKSP
ncbi:MAG: type IV pilus biogenesis/stability protein PilW [Porticoccaceae bacterium]|nr:type IV pilus biogenesis/stability protein PilW [Porticoccaceae bacterium]